MKRIITILAIATLCQVALGQKKYEMVIEKTDGSEIAVNVEDIDRIFFGERNGSFDITYCPDGNHPHMIDLGLPSGTKWACCNVGATTPEGYGNYYAWGETQPKGVYNWSTYQYGSSKDDVVNIGSDIGGTSYDAATANWGAPWRMPSLDQIVELLNNCTSEWTTLNGVNGRKFTGANGGTIFLPASGYHLDDTLNDVGTFGIFWSSVLYGAYMDIVCGMSINSINAKWSGYGRYRGQTLRPVL